MKSLFVPSDEKIIKVIKSGIPLLKIENHFKSFHYEIEKYRIQKLAEKIGVTFDDSGRSSIAVDRWVL